MYTQLDNVQTGRITNVKKVTSLREDYYPDNVVFSMFLNAKANSGVTNGDVMIVEAMLPDTGGVYVDVPVVVGDWSPVVFLALRSADSIDDFSTETNYEAGDLVIYSDVAYRFIADHTAGAWSDSDVEEYPLLDLTKVDAYVAPIKEIKL